MKRTLLLLFGLILSVSSWATHIVGSTLTYVHNGGSSYTFTLRLFRDCGSGSAAFPGTVTINVRGYNGQTFTPTKDFNMTLGTVTNIPSNLDSCAAPPNPMPCVQEGIYTTTVTNLPANPGGYHCYYQVCCRNLSTTNVNASCNCIGASIATYIPGPTVNWFEDFTLANGTTIDAGATAWTRTLGTIAPGYAEVRNNLFETQGVDDAEATWVSQQINIASLTSGALLQVNLSEAGTMDVNDSILVFYSLNSGPFVQFPTNGAIADDFTNAVASTGSLTANTVQIMIRVHYNNNSPTSELYRWDNVVVSANDFVSNGSPSFTLFPPLFLCQGNFFSFNHAATDPDGDSLVYDFYTPYTDVAPTFPGNVATFTGVTWLGGYSATNPLGGPALSLNSSTGILTGTPTNTGQFVVGVMVSEYRNGNLLSTVFRDFQFNVVFCPPPATALIVPGDTLNACSGLSVNFPNNSSANANNWWWNFGDPSATNDTSIVQYPSYSYPSPGSYLVTMITNKGTPCADTSYASVDVGFATANFTHNAPQCAGTNVTFTNLSTCSPNTTITGYSWDFGDSQTSTAANPAHAYATGGTYMVTLITYTALGCIDTTNIPVTINPTPAAPAPSSNSPVCEGSTLNLSTTAVAGATYSWTGPNSFTSSVQNPSIAGVTAAAAGTYSLTVTVAGCTSAAGTTAVTINPTPAAPALSSNSPVCVGSTLNLTTSAVAGATYAWTGPNSFSSSLQNPSIAGATVAASGTYSLTVTVGGCTSPAGTTVVTVSPTPATPTAGSNSPICAGSTLNLTASAIAGATYSWTGPNGFTSAVQNPSIAGATTAATGTYSVTATVAGCTGAAGTVTVTVNPVPAAPTASSNSPVCAGSTINLTASLVAGATYSWTGPGGYTSTAQNPTRANATLAMAGTYSVTVTVGGCTSAAATTVVTVNATPAAPTAGSNSPICSGSTLNLTSTLVAGATYSWTGPNGFTSSVQNPSIAGATTAATGTYSVTVTVGGCTSAAGTTVVTVNPIPATPTPSSNSPICAGSTLTLTTTAVAGATYSWTGPSGYTSAVQNPTRPNATVAMSGTYSLTVTVAGCTSAAGTVSVTVNPIPTTPAASSNSPICAGSTLNLTTPLVAGATYSWTGPNGFSSSVQNPSIAAATTLATGTYSVTITVNGCISAAGTTAVTVNPIPAAPTPSSNSPLCVGATLNLTTSAVAGATYSWTGPNGFTSAVQNPSIAGVTTAATGTYSLTVTVNGCTSPAGTVSVTVNTAPATPTAGSNTPLCTGNTLNLTATFIAGATYSWTGPNGFTSTLQNPAITNVTLAAAGTYTVVANNGCASTPATTTVTINATPATPTAGSNSPICDGSTLNLTSNLVAGATYSWTGPNGFTSAVQNPSIAGATPAATGTYSVTVTVNGCTSAIGTVAVAVNPIPAAPAPSGNSPICAGSTLVLSTTAVAGATYSWTGPSGYTSSVQNPTRPNATVAMSGTYSLTVTVAGCTSPTGTVSVTVNPIPATPAASSNSPICDGDNLNLTTPLVAGATYSWTGPNAFSSSVQNPSIAAATTLATGTYSVTITVNGCTSVAGTTAVTVNPIPATPTASSNSPVCIGATLNFTTSAVAGATYSWTGPNGFTSASQNPSISGVTVAANGTYSLTVTVNGCTSSAGTVAVTVNTAPATPVAGSNSPLCTGASLLLTADTIPGATYSWTGPNGFTSTQQNPAITNITLAAAGTYTVVANNGCASSPATTTVTVNPTPATPTAGSNSPICDGNTLNLTSNFVAGATYSWTGPNGFTSALQNPSIPGATSAEAGTYSVTITVNGCTSAAGTVAVVVNPIPAAPSASANSPVCTGGTLSLTTGAVAGATYNWTGPNAFSSTLQNPNITNVTLAAAGTYSLTITVSGCTGSAGTVTVTVNPTPAAPTASNSGPICDGDNLNLAASNVAGATYSWTGPNGFTDTQQNTSVTGATLAAAGTYSVTVTVNGCTSVAGTTTVIVNPIPAAPSPSSNSPLCIGATLNLTTSAVAGATYSWTGPNAFTSSAQNPSIANVTTAETGTYSLTVTVNGCTSSAGTVSVTVNSAPATPVASSNSPVCSGDSLQLMVDTIPGAVYSWSGPNGFTSTQQNPSITNITLAAAGTYTVIANNGCSSNPATVTVTVNPTPATPSAGSNSPLCEGSTLNLTTPNVASATYSWTGPNSYSSSSQNPSVPNTTPAESGTYSVTVTVNGCTSAAGTETVVIDIQAVVAAGADQTVCANNAVVTLGGSSTNGSGIWTTSGSGTFLPANTDFNATYTPSNADTAAGTVTLTLTSTNNGACVSANDQVVITITDAPVVDAGPDQSVCANNAAIMLNGSFTVATGGVWSTSGTGTLSSTTAMNATYTPDAGDTAAGTVTFVLTSTGNGSCLAVTDTMVLTITPAPIVSAGPDINTCIAFPNTPLSGTSSTGSGTWTTLGSGTFSPNANTLNATYVPSTADTSAGTVTLVLASTANGGCLAEDDTLVIFFTPTPTVSTGPDQTVCANNAAVALTSSSSTNTGIWTTGGDGTFSPSDTTLNATYIPGAADTAAGSVTLTFTATNGCAPISQNVIITITPAPFVNGGPDQFTCANNPDATISATIGGATTTGMWTTSGGGIFTPSNTDLNVTYIPNAADIASGSVTLVLTSTGNGNCLAEVDTVMLTITQPPTASAGADMFACANNAAGLNGVITGGNGTGIWTTTNGTGTFSPSNTALSGSYTPSNADTAAGTIVLVLTSTNNGGCIAVTDTMLIQVIPGPIVSAGADMSACANNPVISLNGSVTVATGGVWTSSGSGTFSPDDTTMNVTYTADTSDVNAGSVTIYLSSTGNGLCNTVTDSMVLVFTPAPVASAGAPQIVCSGTTSVSLGGTVGGGASTGQWTTGGDGTFSPNDSTLNATYTFGTGDTTAASVMLYLISTNNGNCFSAMDSVLITITPVPSSFAGPDTMVCALSSGVVLNGQITGGAGTGVWTTTGSGTFLPDSTALNGTYVPGASDTAAGSVTLVLSSTNACLAESDTVVIAFAPAPVVDAGQNALICAGTNVALNGIITNAPGGQWTTTGDGTFMPSDTIANPTYIPGQADTASGSVTLIYTSSANAFCSGVSDSLAITINQKPVAAFASTAACTNSAVSFTDQSMATLGNIVSWQWTAGSDTSSLQDPSFTFGSAGTQTVTLIVATAAGCADTVSMTVNVNPTPVSYFGSVITCPTDGAFTDSSSITPGTITTWNWNFGDSATSALQNPQHTYTDTGYYYVTLTVTSDSGCVATYGDTLFFIPCAEDDVAPPAVPTAFTPNGDGNNDFLFVRGGPFSDFNFRVYNEWGNEVFVSQSQSVGWDGRYKGKEQPAGSYVWIFTGTTMDGEPVNVSGSVTILR